MACQFKGDLNPDLCINNVLQHLGRSKVDTLSMITIKYNITTERISCYLHVFKYLIFLIDALF